jgi:hypothetical protein
MTKGSCADQDFSSIRFGYGNRKLWPVIECPRDKMETSKRLNKESLKLRARH